MAAGPRTQDARLRRSRFNAAAIRSRGSSPARRASVQLCRPSADRGTGHAAPQCARDCAAASAAAGAAGAAGQPAGRNPSPHGCFGEVLRRLNVEGLAFEACCRRCRISKRSLPKRPDVGPHRPRASSPEKMPSARLSELPTPHWQNQVRSRLSSRGPRTDGRSLSPKRIETAVGKLVVNIPTVILANLVIGENVVPEFILRIAGRQDHAGVARRIGRHAVTAPSGRGLQAPRRHHAGEYRSPSEKAAEIVLEMVSTPLVLPD